MQKSTSNVDSVKFIKKKNEYEMNSWDFVICKKVIDLWAYFDLCFVFDSLHLIIALIIALGPFFLEHAVKTRTEVC